MIFSNILAQNIFINKKLENMAIRNALLIVLPANSPWKKGFDKLDPFIFQQIKSQG